MDFLKGFKNPVAHVGKSSFDLSQKHVFSSKVGQIVPCMALETLPSDHHEIDLAGLTRTLKFNTAAFIRGKFHYDFFFVPYSQIWHPFNQFITTREDKHTSLQKDFNYVPSLNLRAVLSVIHAEYERWYDYHVTGNNSSVLYSTDIQGFAWCFGAVRLLDMLGFGDFSWILRHGLSDDDFYDAYADKHVNIFRLGAYQHIFYDEYRNKQRHLKPFISLGAGYPESEFEQLDEFSFVDSFNFDDVKCNTYANSVIPAYEVATTDGISTLFPTLKLLTLLQLHYHQYKSDVFTAALPSQQLGAVSSIEMNLPNYFAEISSDFGRWKQSFDGGESWSTLIVNRDVRTNGDTHSLYSDGGPANDLQHDHDVAITRGPGQPNNVSFDVLALKRAEALQKWKMNVIRAGNMVDDNFKAHFGVEPYYEGDNNVLRLGSVECMLDVNPVIATATTDSTQSQSKPNTKLGEIGAYGVSVLRGNKIVFDSKDFGVILCLSSYLPEAEYRSLMCDKANRLTEPFDFFSPEFDNLGMDLVTMSDYQMFKTDDDSELVTEGFLLTNLGYVPSYWQYKTAIDKIHGQFNKIDVWDGNDQTENVSGSLCPWVAPRLEEISEFASVYNRKLSSFYVNPSIYDNVFAAYADDKQTTDCFIHNVFFKISSVRPMSVLGLPNL